MMFFVSQMAADAVAVADRQAQAAESGLDASGRPVVTKVRLPGLCHLLLGRSLYTSVINSKS